MSHIPTLKDPHVHTNGGGNEIKIVIIVVGIVALALGSWGIHKWLRNRAARAARLEIEQARLERERAFIAARLERVSVSTHDTSNPPPFGQTDCPESYQHMKITFPGKKMQTMADRFHDALGSSSVIAENVWST
ncbi:unnamed protein product [Trifolium pratense]|uniref:Uncharacterized protein n=1 Tax=Trifolium pratense TaxID=57577 RepID=A0ACB0L378_TRIPR|nr:unnamed protein product [Trifolium pratense]